MGLSIKLRHTCFFILFFSFSFLFFLNFSFFLGVVEDFFGFLVVFLSSSFLEGEARFLLALGLGVVVELEVELFEEEVVFFSFSSFFSFFFPAVAAPFAAVAAAAAAGFFFSTFSFPFSFPSFPSSNPSNFFFFANKLLPTPLLLAYVFPGVLFPSKLATPPLLLRGD